MDGDDYRDDFDCCEVCGRDEHDLCDSCAFDARVQDEERQAWLAEEDRRLYTIPMKGGDDA